SGLYYYRERYYSQVLGRFITEDPIGFRGGLNLYRYVFNNPVRFTDPQGTDLWVGGEGTGILMAGPTGFQGGGGVIMNTSSGEFCAFTLACGRVGLGMILGAGGKGILQTFAPRCGKDVGGWSFALAGDIIVPGFPGASGSLGGGGGLGGGVGFGADVGAGIAAGIDICYVKTRGCLNTPPDCEDCSKSKK
ncbi:MAG: RHS repeat-associated core domain-containing protein, partial [Nitrospira sp.]|nr:RHS repeat-associated core domain-containing protein [Nitrospira sp.]